RTRRPSRALLLIGSSFAGAFPEQSRCARHPTVAPTGLGKGSAIRRLPQAVQGEARRCVAAPHGAPRPAQLLSALAGASKRPGGRSAAAPRARPRLPVRRPTPRAGSAGSRLPALEGRRPWEERNGLVT